jgi:hypothetical protein
MALQGTDIADLVATTINNFAPLQFTDLTSDLQRYIALSRLMKKNKVIFDTSPEYVWDLMIDDNGSAEFKGLYAQDVVGVPDVMIQGKIPWRHVTWNWAIERREIAMNRTPRKIVDLTLTRRVASFISAVKKFENRFWRCPAVSDTVNPFGVPYWVVKNATEGFNGGAPSGYTVVGNVNPTTYPRWKNWTFQYVAVTEDDLIRKWRKAVEFTDFDLADDEIPSFNTGDDWGFYTNWAVLGTLVEILRNRNDDLGPDVAAFEGKTLFMNQKVTRVPQLEEDTTNPIYGLNWGEFKTAGLRGEWLVETKVAIVPGQHTVSATFTDCSLQWFTRNRRRHFVGATGTTMPA